MTRYVAFSLTPQGKIVHTTDLKCDTDEEAKQQAQQLANGHAIELWESLRSRRVAFFPKASSA